MTRSRGAHISGNLTSSYKALKTVLGDLQMIETRVVEIPKKYNLESSIKNLEYSMITYHHTEGEFRNYVLCLLPIADFQAP